MTNNFIHHILSNYLNIFLKSHVIMFISEQQSRHSCMRNIFARLLFQSHCPASDHLARERDAKTLLPRNKKSHGGQRPIS